MRIAGFIRKLMQQPVARGSALVWRSSPGEAALVAALLVAGALLGIATMLVSAGLVGAVAGSATRSHTSANDVTPFLLAWFAISAASSLQSALWPVTLMRLSWTFERHVRQRIVRASLTPKGLAHLEDPEFANELKLALETPGSSIVNLPNMLMQVAAMVLNALGGFIVLARFQWWAPVLLGTIMVLQARWVHDEVALIFESFVATTSNSRRASYYRTVALDRKDAKEIRIFGLSPWIIGRYSTMWLDAMASVWQRRRGLRSVAVRQVSVQLAAYGVIYVAIAQAALAHRISIGAVAAYVAAAGMLGSIGWVGEMQYVLHNAASSIPHFLGLDNHASANRARLAGDCTEVADLPRRELRLDNVRFHYPGVDKPVFDGLTLNVPVGRSTAIVGSNGSGKTTLVKLLTRLYDPDDGSITIDGDDLRTFDPAAWRSRVSVIFQDFVQYPFSARDNIAVGAADMDGGDASIREAIRLAGAGSTIAELPRDWDTVLTKAFDGGVDLSGGEWQKIALARALLGARNGGLLVLDEPTASLDVRAEVELFDRFLELTAGTTTILISHRFSTVRHADHICVLHDGKLQEEGTHEELLALGGHYCRMYTLQASRFGKDADEDADADDSKRGDDEAVEVLDA